MDRKLEKIKDEYITTKAPHWLGKLDVSVLLMADLQRENLLIDTDRQTLEDQTDRVNRRAFLIEILRQGSVEAFKDFCVVLAKHEKQQYLIEDLPECLKKVKDDGPHHSSYPSPAEETPSLGEAHIDIPTLARDLEVFFKNNRVKISAKLHYDGLCDYLEEYNILTDNMRKDLDEEKKTKQARILMDRMKQRSPPEYILLAMAIINSDQEHIISQNGFPKQKLEALKKTFEKCLVERTGQKQP